jgi:acyl carrier protein
MSDVLQIKEKVKAFILEQTFADKSKVIDETFIFKEGYLDSMGFVILIAFLEKEFSIETIDRDLIEENFESINAIANFVIKKSTK